jgi:hypothetical protein
VSWQGTWAPQCELHALYVLGRRKQAVCKHTTHIVPGELLEELDAGEAVGGGVGGVGGGVGGWVGAALNARVCISINWSSGSHC